MALGRAALISRSLRQRRFSSQERGEGRSGLRTLGLAAKGSQKKRLAQIHTFLHETYLALVVLAHPSNC